MPGIVIMMTTINTDIVCWMQMLTVHLEETDCFAAWVSAREVGIGQPSVESSDPKCMFAFVIF